MEGVAVERRKIRLRMSLSNLMEFKKDILLLMVLMVGILHIKMLKIGIIKNAQNQ